MSIAFSKERVNDPRRRYDGKQILWKWCTVSWMEVGLFREGVCRKQCYLNSFTSTTFYPEQCNWTFYRRIEHSFNSSQYALRPGTKDTGNCHKSNSGATRDCLLHCPFVKMVDKICESIPETSSERTSKHSIAMQFQQFPGRGNWIRPLDGNVMVATIYLDLVSTQWSTYSTKCVNAIE